jgi:pimeloyl-ACP methyl ester carboxylesterase
MGALYAQLFPNKIGRVVLDGAVDPTISPYEQVLTQAKSFDNALTDFLQECSINKNCSLPTDVDEARTSIITLLASVAKKPIPLQNSSKDKRELTETLLTLGMAAAFYDSEEGWPKLRTAFRDVKSGYGDEFIKLADQYSGRLKDGTYRSNEFDSGLIIDCLDFSDTRTVTDITTDALKISKLAPVFGPYLGYSGLTCKYLPETKPVTITSITTNAPIMVIGTTRDPATPYQWAIALQKIITNSQLLTLVGDGHTGHNRGSACIDNAVDNFYLKGVLPPKNKRCIATS